MTPYETQTRNISFSEVLSEGIVDWRSTFGRPREFVTGLSEIVTA